MAIDFRGYLVGRQLNHEARAWIDAALALLDDGTSHRRLRLLSAVLASEAVHAEWTDVLERARDLYREADALGDEQTMGLAKLAEAFCGYRAGRITEAVPIVTAAVRHYELSSDNRSPDTRPDALVSDHPFPHQAQLLDALSLQIIFLTTLGRYQEARVVASQIVDKAAQDAEPTHRNHARFYQNVFLSFTAVQAGDLQVAKRLLDIEREYVGRLGPADRFPYVVAQSLLALAGGDPSTAQAAASRLRSILPETTTPDILRDTEMLLALAALHQGRTDDAVSNARQALRCAQAYSSIPATAELVNLIAEIAFTAEDHADAAVLYASASATCERTRLVFARWQQERLEHTLETLQDTLRPPEFDVLWAQGSALTNQAMLERAAHYLASKTASSP